MSLKENWANLSPGNKKKVIWALIAAAVILAAFFYSRGKKPIEPKAVSKRKEVTLDAKLLSKSLYAASQEEIARRDRQIGELKKQVAEDRKKLEERIKGFEARIGEINRTGGDSALSFPGDKDTLIKKRKGAPYPSPPPPPSAPVMPSRPKPKKLEGATEKFIGAISVVSAPETAIVKKDGGKKKEKIYLPSGSFMTAILISGLDAPTVESARGNPMPVLLRIKNLAVLPNRVKADLKGCFAIAHGYGDLASERAYLRLVNLSCLTKKGRAVIDQPVKGYVSDDDGKIGLAGRVVSKMGSLIARSMIAGFFEGVGEAFETASTMTSISSLGNTQTLDPDKLLQAGMGSGIASAANEIQRFYLDLARQTMPIIEVGATKEVTLIVTDGEWLEIKPVNDHGGDVG